MDELEHDFKHNLQTVLSNWLRNVHDTPNEAKNANIHWSVKKADSIVLIIHEFTSQKRYTIATVAKSLNLKCEIITKKNANETQTASVIIKKRTCCF